MDDDFVGAYPLRQQVDDLKALYGPLEELAGRVAHIWLDGGYSALGEGTGGIALDDLAEWCQQNHPDWQG